MDFNDYICANLTNICRICLTINKVLISFNGNIDNNGFELDQPGGLSVADMFANCFKLEIKSDVKFPNFACTRCIEKLQAINSFYNMYLESTDLLNNISHVEIKPCQMPNETDVSSTVGSLNRDQNSLEVSVDSSIMDHTTIIGLEIAYANEQQEQDIENEVDEGFNSKIGDSDIRIIYNNEIVVKKKVQSRKKPCKICGFITSDMKRHLLQHNNPQPYECDLCGAKLSDRCGIRRHLDIHVNARNHQCQFCTSRFNDRSTLRVHLKLHSNELNYVCQYCDKKFNILTNLNEHILTHTKFRKFKCQYCQKAFKRKSHMNRHIMIHTGERPFSCNICDKKYIQKFALQAHKRRVHQM